MWTLREIRIRYKQSLLGAAWAVLQPLALMLVFTLVFSVLARVPTDGEVPYPLFSFTALVPWTLLATSIGFGSTSLISNLNLVTKIYFPREILPIASVGAALLDFAVSMVVLVLLSAFYGFGPRLSFFWLPLLVGVELLLILGIVLPVSAIMVFYRDLRFVVPLGLQVWLFASPVVYPSSLIPEPWRPLYALNPMSGLIDSFRRVLLLGESPEWHGFGVAALFAALAWIFGYWYFKRAEAVFADVI